MVTAVESSCTHATHTARFDTQPVIVQDPTNGKWASSERFNHNDDSYVNFNKGSFIDPQMEFGKDYYIGIESGTGKFGSFLMHVDSANETVISECFHAPQIKSVCAHSRSRPRDLVGLRV